MLLEVDPQVHKKKKKEKEEGGGPSSFPNPSLSPLS